MSTIPTNYNYATSQQSIANSLYTPTTLFTTGNPYLVSNNNNMFSGNNGSGINVLGDTFSMLGQVDAEANAINQKMAYYKAAGITSTNNSSASSNNDMLAQLIEWLKKYINGDEGKTDSADNLDSDTKADIKDMFKDIFGADNISNEALEKYAEMIEDGADLDEVEEEMKSTISDSAAESSAQASKAGQSQANTYGVWREGIRDAYTEIFGKAPTDEELKKYTDMNLSLAKTKEKMKAA